MTFDQYNFCALGCLYCFAYFFKSNNPSIKDLSLRSVNIDRMIKLMDGKDPNNVYYRNFYKRKFLLHWGGLADPFCSFEKTNHEGLKLIKALGERNYPTLFSFKGDGIFGKEYIKVFKKYKKQKNFAFQISIITNDAEMAKRIEIGVPSPKKRFEAMKMLSDMGYYTILRLRPFVIGVSDETLDELLQEAKKAGAQGVSCEFFALDCRSNEGMKSRYDWIGKLIGCNNAKGLHQHFKKLSPSERGGYMRLNRLVKEPYVKKIYKFCAENDMVCGISDPDFKELNTSGSCCAMPDTYPENPGLCNWTRSQLTYHLKEARRAYHITGEDQYLRFEEVYKDESYLDDTACSEDHVSVIGRCNAERRTITQRDILRKQWNNLRSPACARNYLHGKVLPCGTDDDGNLVFKYIVMDYEREWVEEGIDLTR